MRTMSGVQIKDRKRSKDLILVMDLNETIDQLTITNSLCWYGRVLRGRVIMC